MLLKLLMIVFLFSFIWWQLRFPSSGYNPKVVLGSIFSRFDWIGSPARSYTSEPKTAHYNIKASFCWFIFPSFITEKQKEFSTVHDWTEIFIINSVVQFFKLDGICQNIFIDGWVQLLDIKLNNWAILFIGHINKPF